MFFSLYSSEFQLSGCLADWLSSSYLFLYQLSMRGKRLPHHFLDEVALGKERGQHKLYEESYVIAAVFR